MALRYKLRTLLILLAILPPLLAGAWFAWREYQAEQQRRAELEQLQRELQAATANTAAPLLLSELERRLLGEPPK